MPAESTPEAHSCRCSHCGKRPEEEVENFCNALIKDLHAIDCREDCHDSSCRAWKELLPLVEAKSKVVMQRMFPADCTASQEDGCAHCQQLVKEDKLSDTPQDDE